MKTVYARLGFSVAVQYIKYYIKWLKTSTQIKKKKTRGKPKLGPRFAAGTSKKQDEKQRNDVSGIVTSEDMETMSRVSRM